MSKTQILVADRPKEEHGWRAGRPVEDPEKTKRWGFVYAKPSEYLVHVRRGQVRTRSSGQGASCWKWPSDAVAIVPTSFQQLRFVADQVTRERVGVEVHGLAVYRIAEPLVAYRVLNFSYPERAQEKLEQTLTSMFVGATRRLIANLTLEECLEKRKSALADELLKELAPVVGGEGDPDDTTSQGWGLVLDTVEVQEVRVLSEAVFSALQAPYRVALDRQAREARAEADRDISSREAECGRAIAEARMQADLTIQARRREVDAAAAETRRQEALRSAAVAREIEENRLQSEAAVRARQAEIQRREAEERSNEAVLRERLAIEEARAELGAHEARSEVMARRAELDRLVSGLAAEKRRVEAELRKLEGEIGAGVALAEARARREALEGEARLVMAQRLPDLAAAVGGKFGEVKITQIGDGGGSPFGPFGSVAQAIAAVVELVRREG